MENIFLFTLKLYIYFAGVGIQKVQIISVAVSELIMHFRKTLLFKVYLN